MLESLKTDIVYKKYLKRQFTSVNKDWHEEMSGKSFNIKYSDVWTDEIPVIPPASSTSIVQKIENLYLTLDVTVPENKTWLACTVRDDITTQVGDFIEPDRDLSQGYFIKLLDSIGKQIFVGDPVNWQFDYANGVLTFENSPALYIPPFKISGYRYVGIKGRNIAHEVTSLNEAYHGPYLDGGGRTIIADMGPVEIQSQPDIVPFKITPLNVPPTQGVADGAMFTKDGQVFIRDESRQKWIAMNRQTIAFGSKRADGCYLNLNNFSSHMSGWPALRKGTILGVTCQASGGCSDKQFIIMKNNSADALYQFNLNQYYYSNGDLNIDFDANDLIKIFVSSRYATTFNVILTLEIAWTAS